MHAADWRGATLQCMRELIHAAEPAIVEERKWGDTPVWSHAGIVCTGETYKAKVKLTFAKGASLPDPHGLFNASLDGHARRAIDIGEGEAVEAEAFKALVRAAVELNLAGKKGGAATPARPAAKKAAVPAAKPPAKARTPQDAGPPALLSGGNPQIAKGDGDAPVQAYLDAMPGWKRELGHRLDALVVRTVPGVRKAVRWNSPFYGVEGQGWFLSFHVFTRYVKLTFFRGTSLQPLPPGSSKTPETRYLDLHEHDPLDERQLAAWIGQAAAIPGWDGGSPRQYGGVPL